MYTEFFELSEKPFSLVPNPSYLFLSDQHENALAYFEYGLSENIGFLMLTGEIGTGKTTLLRYAVNKMADDVLVALLFNTNLVSHELIFSILSRFEIRYDNGISHAQAVELLNEFLIENYAQGKKAILIIDEAQNLSQKALEEIRMLSNLQTDEELLLQIILVGQPQLRDKIQDLNLEQLAQRIAASYHLTALSFDETKAYILHRLKKAGGSTNLFTLQAIEKIFNISQGIPRTINLICDAAFVYAYADGKTQITSKIVRQVILDKNGIGVFTKQKLSNPPQEQLQETHPNHSYQGLVQQVSHLEKEVSQLNHKMDRLLKMINTAATRKKSHKKTST
ncbi:MAG: AAA family ATPase, partial [Desulfobacteraceae bacterium]|nr:AAA family ATPase [Desulfobacteraceae bacterium]